MILAIDPGLDRCGLAMFHHSVVPDDNLTWNVHDHMAWVAMQLYMIRSIRPPKALVGQGVKGKSAATADKAVEYICSELAMVFERLPEVKAAVIELPATYALYARNRETMHLAGMAESMFKLGIATGAILSCVPRTVTVQLRPADHTKRDVKHGWADKIFHWSGVIHPRLNDDTRSAIWIGAHFLRFTETLSAEKKAASKQRAKEKRRGKGKKFAAHPDLSGAGGLNPPW